MNALRKATLAFVILWTAVAAADDMRCDAKIISTGARKFDVLRSCGEPAYRSVRYERRFKRDFYRELSPNRQQRESEKYREPLFAEEVVEIEEWVYNFGTQQFIRYLTFENGMLAVIETGDYGF